MKLARLRPDWDAVSALLDEALELPAGQRNDWLATLGGERAAHRDVLARLLEPALGPESAALFDALPRLAFGDDAAATSTCASIHRTSSTSSFPRAACSPSSASLRAAGRASARTAGSCRSLASPA
jgi:hypothetical protein